MARLVPLLPLFVAVLVEAAVAFTAHPEQRVEVSRPGHRASAAAPVTIQQARLRGRLRIGNCRPEWRRQLAGVVLGLLAAVLGWRSEAALAKDLANGETVFLGNCAACHAGGNNAVQPDKKLKKEALTQYGMYDVDRIRYQITNGKNAMPAFGERLGPEDIEDVANYVIAQADKGW